MFHSSSLSRALRPVFLNSSLSSRFCLQQTRQAHTKKDLPTLPPFSYKPKPYTGPSFNEVKSLREQHLSPAIFHYYQKPLMVAEGKMQYLFDETGKRYLDSFGGIVTVSVGHCHDKVVEAGRKQLETLQHTTTIYLHPEIVLFAKELTEKLPGNLKNVYFVNSGSEANDLALLMARLHTGNYDVISLRNGYHGMSGGTMGITSLNTWKYPMTLAPGIHPAVNPNTYRGPFTRESHPTDAYKHYANDVKDIIVHNTPGKVAGFIAETIQGVGGIVELPDGYLKEVYSTIRSSGGVCIADEVQSGFGRLGTHYWGFETQGVVPDIVTMAKGIGNGAPLAAVVTTPEISKSLVGKLHFNTYGGNPVSSAMGRAVLRVIDEEKMQHNSLELGNHYKQGLLKLQEKYDFIGDVRGKGLMLGVELVKDRKTKQPLDKDVVNKMFEKTKDLGLLIGKGGLYGNVLRIAPPMCITKPDVDFALAVLDRAFSQH